ncbi:hypothetical protein Tco_0088599 [Tanacetum coccineum]
MHNNIMAAGSRDRPPMLATGRYAQWRSRFLRYIDTRPNGDALRKCILKEAIHLILTGIGDEIYSTVDACQTAQEMWEAIERLQQVATMQVNVQFLQQLQPEWSRFVTIVKQQHKLDEVSYHKLFDILKQYQKEVNEPPRSHATTRYKGKEIAKPITPPSESASEEDSDPEQAQKDKDIKKNVDATLRYENDNQTGQFGNQRAVNVVGARETVGVPNADSGTDAEPLEQVQYDTDDNVFANDIQLFDQSESINTKMNVECDDERVALANLIANLKLDVDEKKKIQKQLKKANATLTQELTECKSILAKLVEL